MPAYTEQTLVYFQAQYPLSKLASPYPNAVQTLFLIKKNPFCDIF